MAVVWTTATVRPSRAARALAAARVLIAPVVKTNASEKD